MLLDDSESNNGPWPSDFSGELQMSQNWKDCSTIRFAFETGSRPKVLGHHEVDALRVFRFLRPQFLKIIIFINQLFYVHLHSRLDGNIESKSSNNILLNIIEILFLL